MFVSSQQPQARSRRAFTFMEILVVLAIVGILIGLTFSLLTSSQKSMDNITAQVNSAVNKGQKKVPARKPGPAKAVPNEHIVTFKVGTADPAAEAKRLADLCSGTVLTIFKEGILGCALRIGEGTLEILKSDPIVSTLEPNWYVSYCAQTVPTGIRRLKVPLGPETFSVNPPSPTIRNLGKSSWVPVAVIDSGIDSSHPDLNVVFSKGFGPVTADAVGHGTHVSGIIGAHHNDIGVVGVAPGAPLWNLNVDDGTGNPTTLNIINAMIFAAANSDKVFVINMSLGGPTSAAMNAAAAACVKKGQIVVVAAGNSSLDASTFSPASEPSVITVAALADSDGLPGAKGPKTSAGNDDTFATFSNYGTIVDVIAPGVDILSTAPLGPSMIFGAKSGGYGTISGTSMASPYVAGLAVRLRSQKGQPIRNLGRTNPSGLPAGVVTTADFLQTMLATSTENIPGRFDARTYPLVSTPP